MDKYNTTSHIPIRKKPRKIMVIRPSKYEAAGAIHTNKEYWRNLLETSKQADREISESQKLSEVLPPELYVKVCSALGIPIKPVSAPKGDITESSVGKPRQMIKNPMLSYRHAFVVERELDSDTDVELSPREDGEKTNIHLELLKRPEREQITWPTRYLQPEREDEKTLIRKADDLTNRIADEFCDYMKQLGGNQQSKLFTPKAIKELFQIEFDTHVARGLSVVPKVLHSVHEKIANVTGNLEQSHHSILEREVSKDIEADASVDRVQAFDRSLPIHEQYRAPRNDAKRLWRSSRYVPKDLVTLKTVWDGITNLRSVKEYCRWMIENPEYKRAPYLNSLGLFDSAVLDARLTLESGHDLTPSYEPDTKDSIKLGPKANIKIDEYSKFSSP